MMRYDGLIVPGNPHHVAPSCQDPRNKVRNVFFVKSLKFSLKIHEIFVKSFQIPAALWRRIEPMDLPGMIKVLISRKIRW